MLEIKEVQDVLIAKLKDSERLNALVTEPIREKLLELFSRSNTKLIFDLQGISFIDSTGFALFLQANKAANNNNGSFKICNVSSDVMELFRLLQLHHVFELYDGLDACLKSFTKE